MVEIFIVKDPDGKTFVFKLILPDGSNIVRNTDDFDDPDFSCLLPYEKSEAKMVYFDSDDELSACCLDVRFGTIHDITAEDFNFTDH